MKITSPKTRVFIDFYPQIFTKKDAARTSFSLHRIGIVLIVRLYVLVVDKPHSSAFSCQHIHGL